MATGYGSVPPLNDAHAGRGYGGTQQADFAQGNPTQSSPLGQSAMQNHGLHNEHYDESNPASSVAGDGSLNRSASRASQSTTAIGAGGVSRNNTLKKKSSVRRTSSLKRSGSKRSLRAGSIKAYGDGLADNENFNSPFFTPVPTTGTPTEILANRFQAWRQLLKSLITYFREIHTSYETRAKALHKVSITIANISYPAVFMSQHGLGEATRILDDYHRRSVSEANKSREIENDVIGALSGLRSDLAQKIKEIKSLSGDFKNSVSKEQDLTRREVEKLQEALQHADHEDAMGKNDPYIVRLGVDRAIEKQIDEENYLHRAYLNLESSGRELESIVVGEIQKAYNALAGILKREGDDAYSAVEGLRTGPIAMPKDQEWNSFVRHDPHFVDPELPLRRIEDIDYPGKNAPAAAEIRSGMLERKSKYLKSYTPGWYVLSPTHLHEFKSADKIYSQPPVMSLYLLDQKLGSRSEPGSSSHKFMLKGKQSGGMHKGHNWVFRAESYDTMMAWFEDIRILTEKTGEERAVFVRKHARSVSGTSDRGTVSSDGMDEDEADQVPYSADAASLAEQNPVQQRPTRPQSGGRFPSDLMLRKTGTMSSTADGNDDSDDDDDAAAIAAAGVIGGSAVHDYGDKDPYHMPGVRSTSNYTDNTAGTGGGSYIEDVPAAYQQEYPQPPLPQQTVPAQQPTQQTAPVQTQTYALPTNAQQPVNQQQPFPVNEPADSTAANPSLAQPVRYNSAYGDWMVPAAAGVAGAGAGALGVETYSRHQKDATVPEILEKFPEFDGSQDGSQDAVAGSAAVPSYASDINPGLLPKEELSVSATPLPPAPIEQAVPSPIVPLGSIAAIAGTPPADISSPIKDLADESAPITANLEPVGSVAELPLGGNERKGAHETGQFFPRVIRHDTNLSISKLHVPGEWSKGPSA
ncbi:Phosphatidylinositol 4,5-bisphosphate-binding protein SLM1 [Fulvia fulva]|uniref:Phosphatidylinositol 4,5-bisphosphate-binding protein SLM1 n=1 Tax=Passalora fulva TaxID=5499 RepID=A0A9Q8PJ19_PASFU|nr:Phosphatidylinositol 4,5-bisphosphate-binding protein SLM1 [Fulvia fulva]UJO23368.1 Phosphatidylinositol 4,5-bisphosphate-binding protein SLM1 [Fulvia fulva]WPV36446.1 Phosphatidylinositol 4,5-bisphosphate-binding protein SLM1 [Fulvia fulva]